MQSLPEAPYKIKYPGLFASGDSAIVSEIKTTNADPSVMNYKDGVPEVFAQDPNEDGKFLELGMVNAIGKMASAGPYMSQIGYVYTYEPEIAEAIGGYAKGAVLRYSTASGESVLVQSCKANNKANFVANPGLIDGENWSRLSTETSLRASVFPDYTSGTMVTSLISNRTVGNNEIVFSYTVPYDAFIVFTVFGSATGGSSGDFDFYVQNGDTPSRITESIWAGSEFRDIRDTAYLRAGTIVNLISSAGYIGINKLSICLNVFKLLPL